MRRQAACQLRGIVRRLIPVTVSLRRNVLSREGGPCTASVEQARSLLPFPDDTDDLRKLCGCGARHNRSNLARTGRCGAHISRTPAGGTERANLRIHRKTSGRKERDRFYNIDHNTYLEGALPAKTKELMGLVASACLRCDDCIIYHAIQAYRLGAPRTEQEESLNVALVVGGSIVIPHLRRAYELLEELYG